LLLGDSVGLLVRCTYPFYPNG